MIERKTGAVALSLLMMLCSTAHALNLNHHRAVTNVALQSFQLCLAYEKQTDLLSAGAHKILKGAKIESLSPPLQRYFNWHFHDALRDTEQAMGQNWLGVERSIHALHMQRLQDLTQSIENMQVNDIYETTGRLLHHLQDMAVPANVAPIYHEQLFDVAEPDPFGEMIMWKNPRYIWQRKSCTLQAVTLEAFKQAMPDLLDATAASTRRAIRRDIDVGPEHPLHGKQWTEFWTLRDASVEYTDTPHGFAPWGPAGADGFPQLCSTDRELCLRFFNGRYADAVDASIKALMMINQLLLARQQ